MTLDAEAARAFVAARHRAVLVTRRPDGRLQTSPVLCGAHADGRVAVSTREGAAKVANVRRDPRVALCVLDDGFFGEWAHLDGRAEVVGLPEAMEGLVALYRQVAGEHPDWEGFRAAMQDQRRVLLLVQVDPAGPRPAG